MKFPQFNYRQDYILIYYFCGLYNFLRAYNFANAFCCRYLHLNRMKRVRRIFHGKMKKKIILYGILGAFGGEEKKTKIGSKIQTFHVHWFCSLQINQVQT